MKARLLACLFSLCLVSVSQAASVTAILAQKQINQDETVSLTIRIDSQQQGVNPDFSGLEQDFDMLSRSQRSQIQIINGKKTAYTDWVLTLAPKRSGILIIPAIQVGNARSQPVPLTVRTDEQQRQSGQSPDIFLTMETEQDSVYVQAQLIVSLRLYTRVSIQRGALTPPEPSHATVIPLGEDSQTTTKIGTENYDVIERRYAIFPEASGELTIPPSLFEGEIKIPGRSRSSGLGGFGFFNDNLKTLRIRSKALKVTVKPQAAGFTGSHWLAARNLQIHASWQPTPPEFKVGEAVTRSFILRAIGLQGGQLPPLPQTDLAGLTFYPDKAQQQNQVEANHIIGLMGQKVAIRPNQAGEYVLPAIEIPWWDTAADIQRYARIPAHTIQVAAAAPTDALLPPQVQANLPIEIDTVQPALSPVSEIMPQSSQKTLPNWLIWLTVFFGLGWLLTALTWWQQHRNTSTKTVGKPVVINLRAQRKTIQQACQRNNAVQTQQALLMWAKARWQTHPPVNLQQLANRLDNATSTELLHIISQHLYAQSPENWQGESTWAGLKAILIQTEKKQKHKSKPQPLPPLYPV